MALVQQGLERAIVLHAVGEAVADDRDVIAGARRAVFGLSGW
jgi:hypothetical protein